MSSNLFRSALAARRSSRKCVDARKYSGLLISMQPKKTANPTSCDFHGSNLKYYSTSSIVRGGTARMFEFETLVEMQTKSCEINKDLPVFGTRVPGVDGKPTTYEWITFEEVGDMVEHFRKVLNHHHVGKNDKVAIISNNRVEWAIANYATVSLGAQFVPMYEAQTEKDWKYIIDNSDSKLIIAATETIYEKVKGFIGTVGKVESVLCLDAPIDYMHSYKRWMQLVRKDPPVPIANVSPNDICVVIYTSGTTGNPKGVELSHANIVSNILGLKDLYGEMLDNKTTMAFLPWAHVYGQTTELHSLFALGSKMGIVANRDLIIDSIGIIKPSLICSVPVLFNRIYDGVMKKMNDESALKRKIFHAALNVSRQRNELLEFGQPVGAWLAFKHKIADKIVFSKIRERLGGKLTYMSSGGAAASLKVLQFFEDIGIPICEGYGLTETSPVVTASTPNNWKNRRLGTCGVPLKGVDLKILDPETKKEMDPDTDGEVCVSGPNVMVGYRNNPKANDEVFFFKDGKRYFRTGDLGRMVEGRFLKITGRIKEQYKLENGKYVVPAPLEDAMTRSHFIAQSFLFGDNKPYNVAIIVPDFVELRAWAMKNNIEGWTDDLSLVNHSAVVKLFGDELQHVCSLMKSYERPSKWSCIMEPFTQENQMLTPKMSFRRNNIIKAYMPLIEDMYNEKAGTKVTHVSSTSHE